MNDLDRALRVGTPSDVSLAATTSVRVKIAIGAEQWR